MRGGHLAWVAAAALLGTTPALAEHLDAGERQRGAEIVVLALGEGDRHRAGQRRGAGRGGGLHGEHGDQP